MTDHDSSSNQSQPAGSFWKTRAGVALIVFLAIAGLVLVLEHRAHIFAGDGLLVLLLVVCIGMHFFMHGGHGGHSGGNHGHDDSNHGDRL